MNRKSPVRHIVHNHIRLGRRVHQYFRGCGQPKLPSLRREKILQKRLSNSPVFKNYVEKAMRKHILTKGQVVGLYKKRK